MSGASSIVGGFQAQDVIAGMFFLILIFLLVQNWKGATALLQSSSSALIGVTKTLQGR